MDKILSGRTDILTSVEPEISWPKEFPELKLIDEELRCGICYDYIKTCLVTPCAHSYCSICIRKSLLYKTACPTCYEITFDTNLTKNRNMDKLIKLFQSIRDKLIKHLRIAAVHFNCNEKFQSPKISLNLTSHKAATQQDETPKRNNQHSRKSSTKGKLAFKSPTVDNSIKKSEISKRLEDLLGTTSMHCSEKMESDVLELTNEDERPRIPTVPPMFLQSKVECQSRNDNPTVLCPICGVNIPERNINAHLDNCLINVNKSPVTRPVPPKQNRKPLPKLVWKLLPDKDLRKKLKEYGLNTQGDRNTLIGRIRSYTLLYNSECDRETPRPISEIIQQVEREEKQVASNSILKRMVINQNSHPKKIEEVNKQYLQENKDSFKKLIEAMREREGRNIRPIAKSSNVILSDEDEDIPKDQSKIVNVTPTKPPDIPSTSAEPWEHIDLDDSNSNERSSPILGGLVSGRKLCNENSPVCSDTSPVCSETSPVCSQHSTSQGNICDRQTPELDIETSGRNSSERNFSVVDQNSFSSPPKGRLSPSCIITCHSDSEDSISLLVDQNIGDDFLNNAIGPETENVLSGNSQLEDPDFVFNTEDQNENCSEEVLIPRRKSKRKLKSPNIVKLSPRRKRRCTKK